jgi:hypothetical protein
MGRFVRCIEGCTTSYKIKIEDIQKEWEPR